MRRNRFFFFPLLVLISYIGGDRITKKEKVEKYKIYVKPFLNVFRRFYHLGERRLLLVFLRDKISIQRFQKDFNGNFGGNFGEEN